MGLGDILFMAKLFPKASFSMTTDPKLHKVKAGYPKIVV